MGWEQRSRRRLPPEAMCYLCGQAIAPYQEWNKDHVPPQRFYSKTVRSTFTPNLGALHTHRTCNTSYKKDEEYYVAAFSGHADSPTGRSVFADWQRGVAKGHDAGLLRTIMSQWGKVTLADGSRVFNYDVDRTGRVTWKLIRGLYFAEVGGFLPDALPKRLSMLSAHENQRAVEKYPWWPLVRDTEPMGAYGAVFDYKWLCTTVDGIRGHAIGLLLWDRLLVLALFHDPSCRCSNCEEATRS